MTQMTVSELIDELVKMNQQLPVWIEESSGDLRQLTISEEGLDRVTLYPGG